MYFEEIYYNFDKLLNNADIEIQNILNNKNKNKIIMNNNNTELHNNQINNNQTDNNNDNQNDNQNNNNNLSYDVKKCLAKQKTHELKRQQKSKVFQKKETDNLMNIIYNSNK